MSLKILVVDDNQRLVDFLAMYLSKKGYNAQGVTSVPEALGIIAQEKFDVLIVDACFEHVSGLTLLKSLRSRGDLTPVIMMSGYAQPQQVQECLKLGADDFLFKPFRLEVLADILQGIESRNRRFAKMGVQP